MSMSRLQPSHSKSCTRFSAVFLTLCALLLGLAATARAELPTPEGGIGGLSWGQQIAGQPGFLKIKTKGDARFYIRNDDPFTLYDTNVPRVIYGARDGKLFAAYVHMDDKTLFDRLEKDFTQKYGQPTKKKAGDVAIIQWKKGSFQIKLKEYLLSGILKLGFYYEPLSRDVNMSTIETVVDKIYEEELETYWIKDQP